MDGDRCFVIIQWMSVLIIGVKKITLFIWAMMLCFDNPLQARVPGISHPSASNDDSNKIKKSDKLRTSKIDISNSWIDLYEAHVDHSMPY